jgi:dynein heavy chain
MSMEWNDGVLSTMMSRLCKDESLDQRWMILDGPVDTLWIESMNTVLDDNKVLTLLNGDRISLPPQVSLIFEVEDLSVASPATVSRAGMIYIDGQDLGWRPYMDAWIGKIKDQALQEWFYEYVDKWIDRLFKSRSMCKELVVCLDINIVISLCRLMEAFIKTEGAYISLDLPEKTEIYWALLEKWWCFSLIWSFGATVNEDGRKMIDYHMRDIESMFPHSNTVYDYFINNDKNEWSSWEDKINATVWKPPANQPYHKM